MTFLRVMLGAVFWVLLFTSAKDVRKAYDFESAATAEYDRKPLPDRDFVYYVVQQGDSTSLLQRKFRIASRDSIAKLNPDLNLDRLTAGTQIKLPL